MQPIDLGSALAVPRSRTLGFLRPPETGSVAIPVAVLRGPREDPTVWVNASIHGDEYLGPAALARLLREVDPASLEGRLILTPVLNLPAYREMRREASGSRADMNRIWDTTDLPRDLMTFRSLVESEILSRCGAVVDLHSGGNRYRQTPFAAFHRTGGNVDAASDALAKASALPIVWAHAGSILETSLIAAAARRGKPAVLLEVGGEGLAEEPDVDRMTNALLGVLRAARAVRGKPRYLASYRVFEGFSLVRNRMEGLWRRAVEPGADVREADPLGTVMDAFGSVLEVVSSPVDGVVLGITTYGFVAAQDYIAEIGSGFRREGARARPGWAGSPARTVPRDPAR